MLDDNRSGDGTEATPPTWAYDAALAKTIGQVPAIVMAMIEAAGGQWDPAAVATATGLDPERATLAAAKLMRNGLLRPTGFEVVVR